MFHQLEDTIVAVSSAPGASPRGIVRLSGARALEWADALFAAAPGLRLRECRGHRRVTGQVLVDGQHVPAEAYVFRGPASYTRQDIVELHTVGSPPLLSMIAESLVQAGARMADPGEFTARAFFNGALDLTRVEGVAAAVAARSDAQLRASQYLLHGGLGRRMSAWREDLADLLAMIEAEIDFVEESMTFVTAREVRTRVQAALSQVRDTLAASTSLERLDVLPEVMLTGRPNAGKSTLFNRLSGADRAICSMVAGTTRDLLRAPVSLPGGECILTDSAGLFDEPPDRDRESARIDELARAAALQALETADLVVLVTDISQSAPQPRSLHAVPAARPMLLVGNKRDLVAAEQIQQWMSAVRAADEETPPLGAVAVSAATGEGIDELRQLLDERLFSGVAHRGPETIGLTARQHQALRDTQDALVRALKLLDDTADLGGCAELVAIELREAANAAALLTGEVTSEDLLGRIFSRFCIGK